METRCEESSRWGRNLEKSYLFGAKFLRSRRRWNRCLPESVSSCEAAVSVEQNNSIMGTIHIFMESHKFPFFFLLRSFSKSSSIFFLPQPSHSHSLCVYVGVQTERKEIFNSWMCFNKNLEMLPTCLSVSFVFPQTYFSETLQHMFYGSIINFPFISRTLSKIFHKICAGETTER